MNRVTVALIRTMGVLVGLTYAGGTALAHAGQHGGTDTSAVALVLIGVGGSALGVTAVLDRVGSVDHRVADAAVVVGLLAVVGGVAVYMF